jgi:hypothetical protein
MSPASERTLWRFGPKGHLSSFATPKHVQAPKRPSRSGGKDLLGPSGSRKSDWLFGRQLRSYAHPYINSQSFTWSCTSWLSGGLDRYLLQHSHADKAMTNLCSICRQFDLNVFRGHGVLQSDATYAALSLDKTIYGREEQDYLRSFKAAFVKDGERKGCDFCRLLWDVTKGARNSVQQLNLRHFSIHLRAMVLPGRDNCEPEDSRTRWRINHDTRAYPLGPQVVTEFPMGKGPLKLTHFEVIFDEFDSAESMYHGKIHVHAARGRSPTDGHECLLVSSKSHICLCRAIVTVASLCR